MEGDRQTRITELIDEHDIIRVVNSYFWALDERDFGSERFAAFLADDAEVTRPNGQTMVGLEAIRASHAESLHHFESTQHLLTGHEVSISHKSATAQANVVAMHMYEGSRQEARGHNFFVAGGVLTTELARLGDGWRIVRARNDVAWRSGNGDRLLALFQSMKRADGENQRQP